MRIWEASKSVKLNVSKVIESGFDAGYDDSIEEEHRERLKAFCIWVETNYHIPITLWVDFEDKQYVVGRDKKRKGYLFYWSDFADYPNFEDVNSIPMIRLPVSERNSSFKDVIRSFVEAISDYFIWISNLDPYEYEADQDEVDEIMQKYFATGK